MAMTASGQRVSGSSVVSLSGASGPAIESIEEIAKQNRLPLGLVLGDQTLCKRSLDLRKVGQTARLDVLLQEIHRQVPSYDARIEKGTLVIMPHEPGAGAADLLDLSIPYFRPVPATMEGTGQILWTYVRARIKPREGSLTDIMSNPDSPIISGLHVDSPTSVLDILDLVVQQNQGGAWVVGSIPDDWRERVASNPISITSYSSSTSRLAGSVCADN